MEFLVGGDLNFLAICIYGTLSLTWMSGLFITAIHIFKKNTGDSSAFTFITGLVLCNFLLHAGLVQSILLLTFVSSLGCILHSCYIAAFLINANNRTQPLMQLVVALIVIVASNIVFWIKCTNCWTREPNVRDEFWQVFENVTMGSMLLFFASPLSQLLQVMRTKRTDSVQFATIILCFLTSMLMFQRRYCFDGLETPRIQIPLIIGIVLTGFQFLFFGMYFLIDPTRVGRRSRYCTWHTIC